jgi:hypothetical protein
VDVPEVLTDSSISETNEQEAIFRRYGAAEQFAKRKI